jgi:hypothetical protein
MVGGGLMQLVACGAYNIYFNHENKTTLNSNKIHQYFGKNNFYKKHNKKIIKEIKNKENLKKNIKNTDKLIKTTNKIKQSIYTNNIYHNNNSINNFIRCLSIKISIKKNIIEFIKKNCDNLNDNLLSSIYIKYYYIFLFIIIKQFYNNPNINVKDISINNIDSIYLLKFKNIIIENNSVNKFLKIISIQLKIFFEKQFYFKVKIFKKNNIQLKKSNEYCPITLESLDNIYFYCCKCDTKYSLDGLMYWCQTNHKCTTYWCSNNINKFDFYNENNNLNEFTIVNQINLFYDLIMSL